MAVGDQTQFQATDGATKSSLKPTVGIGQNVWQEAYDSAQSNQTARGQLAHPAKAKPTSEKVCAPSSSYLKFINNALAEAYAPEKFGDPEKIRHEFDCDIHSEADARKYASIVLKRSDDSHTRILSPNENKKWTAAGNPNFVGFGLKTTFNPDYSSPETLRGVAVALPFPGSPGELAGLQTGDRILSVDSQDLTNLPSDVANAKLQGVSGSVARLVVERDGQAMNVDVERKLFAPPAVTDLSRPNDIAYIAIDNFLNEHVADQLQTAILKHPDAKGFVIDLRQNGGGNVDLEMLSLSEVMKDGDIMKTRSRNTDDTTHVSYLTAKYKLTPQGIQKTETSELPTDYTLKIGNTNQTVTFSSLPLSKVTLQKRMKNLVGNRPVDILTDDGTASAAEMFAGAEHDTGKAKRVGTYTYGKGIGGLWTSDQLPQQAGEVISNMHWWTPAGDWAGDAEKQKHGLKPDLEVVNPFGAILLTSNDKQLSAAEEDLQARIAQKDR